MRDLASQLHVPEGILGDTRFRNHWLQWQEMIDMAVDLREPIPLRVETYDKTGTKVGDFVIGDDEPVVSPEQAATMALHADTVVRAVICSIESGEIVLDRTKDPDGHGYLDA